MYITRFKHERIARNFALNELKTEDIKHSKGVNK